MGIITIGLDPEGIRINEIAVDGRIETLEALGMGREIEDNSSAIRHSCSQIKFCSASVSVDKEDMTLDPPEVGREESLADDTNDIADSADIGLELRLQKSSS